MFQYVTKISRKHPPIWWMLIVGFLTINVQFPSNAYAQVALPTPGVMIELSSQFNQMSPKGIIIDPSNPLKFDFIFDQGDKPLSQEHLQQETKKIVEYFLAGLTTPQKDIWVNLSPYEKDRIVPDSFGKTVMGQDLLAQDYILKQIMATALYPKKELGKTFWQKVYAEAQAKFGTTNIQFNTFNKVWIVPNNAVVYQNAKKHAAFIVDGSLKVMLEQDYLAMKAAGPAAAAPHLSSAKSGLRANKDTASASPAALTAQAIQDIVIPALTKEVNTGKNFATLRQVYHALILAKWFKQNVRQHLLAKGYVNRNKILGVKGDDEGLSQKIYGQYLKAYRKGVYNFIQEEQDPTTQRVMPRKYFSGGFSANFDVSTSGSAAMVSKAALALPFLATVLLTMPSKAYAQAEGQSGVFGNQTIQRNVGSPKDIIRQATHGGGDALAASEAFKNMRSLDPDIARYAGQILRLTNNTVDAPLSLSFSFPWGITIDGLGSNLMNGLRYMQQTNDVGSSTLRMWAAAYLGKYAKQIEQSGLWDQVFGTGIWQSLTNNNETNPTVRMAKLLAIKAMIEAGKESRMGGNRITGMDFVETSLKSSYMQERLYAIAVLGALKAQDRDRRLHELIVKAIEGASGPRELSAAASAAVKQEMATAIAPLIKQVEKLSGQKPDAKNVIGFINWYGEIYKVMEQISALSKGNAPQTLAALQALSEGLTGANATDAVNTVYLGLLYMAAQRGDLTPELYVQELNRLRGQARMPGVSLARINFGSKNVNLAKALGELGEGRNADDNARILSMDCGPLCTEALLEILKLEPNTETVLSIMRHFSYVTDTGVFARNNILENVIIGILSKRDAYDSMSKDMLAGLANSGIAVSSGAVRKIVSFVLAMPNSAGSAIGFSESALNELTGHAAKVIHNAGRINEAIGYTNVPLTLEGRANAQRLIEALPRAGAAIPASYGAVAPRGGTVGGPVAVAPSVGGGGGSWLTAETSLRGYLDGNPDAAKREAVVKSIIAANGARSGMLNDATPGAFLGKIMVDPKYASPAKKIQLAEVFNDLKDMGFGYLVGMLNSGNVSVDIYVLALIEKSTSSQRPTAAKAIVETLQAWISRRDTNNVSTLDNADMMFIQSVAVLRAIGSQAAQRAIDDQLKIAEPKMRLVLLQVASIVNSGQNPRSIVEPWTHALKQVIEGTNVVGGLNAMLQLPAYPAVAWDDSQHLMGFRGIQQADLRTKVIALTGEIAQSFPASVVPVVQMEQRAKLLSDEIKAVVTQAKEGVIDVRERMQELAKSALNMPSEYAKTLMLQIIKSGREAFPNFGQFENQWGNYFKLLESLRKMIDESPEGIKESIISFILSDIKSRQETARRYENPELRILLISLNGGIFGQLPWDYEVKRQSFAPLPEVSWNNTQEALRAITQTRQILAGQIAQTGLPLDQNGAPRPINVNAAVADNDVLGLFAALLSRDAQQQISALANLGKYAVLLPYFEADFHPAESKVGTAQAFVSAQLFAKTKEDIRYKEHPFDGLTEERSILMAGILANSQDPRMYRLQLDTLRNNPEIWKSNPALVDRIIEDLGKRGNPEAVWVLADLLIKYDLFRDYVGLKIAARYRDSRAYRIENAIKEIGLVSGNGPKVRAILKSMSTAVANSQGYWGSLTATSVLDTIHDAIPANPAQTSITPGGIDLAQTSLQVKGDDAMLSISRDEAQRLNQLLNAAGLIPVVDSIKPITMPIVAQLLG